MARRRSPSKRSREIRKRIVPNIVVRDVETGRLGAVLDTDDTFRVASVTFGDDAKLVSYIMIRPAEYDPVETVELALACGVDDSDAVAAAEELGSYALVQCIREALERKEA